MDNQWRSGVLHDAPAHETAPQVQMHTVLGAGCSIEGKLVCNGPTRLDGDLRGEIEADDLVFIGPDATVAADLNVQELIVQGRVQGNISAVRKVSLAPSARIEGDVNTPSLAIEEGAQVRGTVVVAPGAPKPAPKQAARVQDYARVEETI